MARVILLATKSAKIYFTDVL